MTLLGVCVGHTLRAPVVGACLCRLTRLDSGGVLWALPIMGASRGPLWRIRMRMEILAPAYKEPVGVTMISGTL